MMHFNIKAALGLLVGALASHANAADREYDEIMQRDPHVCPEERQDSQGAAIRFARGMSLVEQLVVKLRVSERTEADPRALMDDVMKTQLRAYQHSRLLGAHGLAPAFEAASVLRPMTRDTFVIALGGQFDRSEAESLAHALRAHAVVDSVELVGRTGFRHSGTASRTPSDPRYAEQWYLFDPHAGVNAPQAWALTVANPRVLTSIIDSGFVSHVDLDPNRVSEGKSMATADGRPNHARESNGYNGWHGTQVASVMSAVSDNQILMASVGWNAKVDHIRVIDYLGTLLFTDVADAIRWAAGADVPGEPPNPNPGKIINLSLGSYGACPAYLQDAIDAAVMRDVTVVAAAGNQGYPAAWVYPANCLRVIAVAGTDIDGRRYRAEGNVSNYGSAVSISAPGKHILAATNDGVSSVGADSAEFSTGTSLSAPLVSGVVALMLSANPNLKPDHIKHILETTARKPAADKPLDRCDAPPGGGIVDAAAAVKAAQSML